MTTQTHHFYDYDRHGDDIHSVVGTAMLATGRYKAWLIEGLGDDLDVRGYGHTVLSAIADLNAAIAKGEAA